MSDVFGGIEVEVVRTFFRDRMTPKFFTTIYQNLPENRQLDVVEYIFEAGDAFLLRGDTRDDVHYMPMLWWASEQGHEDLVRLLLDTGELDIADEAWAQTTPLFEAASHGHDAVVKLLLDRRDSVETIDHCLDAPLAIAAGRGYATAVRILLERGADVHTLSMWGETPFSKACNEGYKDIAKVLLEYGSEIDFRDTCDYTPLLSASFEGFRGIVHLLLEKGAQLEVRNDLGWTPLFAAVREGHFEVAKALLEKGARGNVRDNDGETALMLAINTSDAMTALLLQNGAQADIDVVDCSGLAPLHVAVSKGYHQTVHLLMDHDAGLEVKDETGKDWTALHYAAANNDGMLIMHLLLKGASLDARSRQGMTPIDEAVQRRHEMAVVLLDAWRARALGPQARVGHGRRGI